MTREEAIEILNEIKEFLKENIKKYDRQNAQQNKRHGRPEINDLLLESGEGR